MSLYAKCPRNSERMQSIFYDCLKNATLWSWMGKGKFSTEITNFPIPQQCNLILIQNSSMQNSHAAHNDINNLSQNIV